MTCSADKTDERSLAQRVNSYSWYHRIEVAPGIFTIPRDKAFPHIWNFIEDNIADFDFAGRRVLDLGCRDGMFSFAAERRGASSVHGIDNDLSRGAAELLIPHFRSRVTMEQLSVY